MATLLTAASASGRKRSTTAFSTNITFRSTPPPRRRRASISTTTNSRITPRQAWPSDVAALKKFESEFEKLPESPDRDLVLSNIRAGLLELETVRGWERNPDNYSSGITNSAFVIMSRTLRASGSAPEVAHRARAPDAQGSGRSSREPQGSAADFYRGRDRADARQHLVLRERCSAGVQVRDRSEARSPTFTRPTTRSSRRSRNTSSG